MQSLQLLFLSPSTFAILFAALPMTRQGASAQLLLQHALIQHHSSSSEEPLVSSCGAYLPAYPRVVCVRNYGAVMPGNFSRQVRNDIGHADTFPSICIPDDTSFSQVSHAEFVIFDATLAPDILGPYPMQTFMFELASSTHEGPVYVPESNELYISRLEHHFLPQLVVDLNAEPPILLERTANPPIYAGAGARHKNGLIYYATLGGHEDLAGNVFRPGIYTLNTTSNQSVCLLNNYYGYYFNGVDDLDISPSGDIWFTDNDYSHAKRINTQPPQLALGTYRFTPSTGFVTLVESTLLEPNGIAFSPSSRTLYLSDTGAGLPLTPHGPLTYTSTGPRTIFAFDVSKDFSTLSNKRPIYQAMEYAPDGMKVSRDGYLVVGAGHGVDVLTAEGRPVLRVSMNFTVANIAFVGKDGEELWAVGQYGAARVRWALRGPPL